MHHMFIGLNNVPACKAGRKSTTGPLDMVPYPPDFLTDSQLKCEMNFEIKIRTIPHGGPFMISTWVLFFFIFSIYVLPIWLRDFVGWIKYNNKNWKKKLYGCAVQTTKESDCPTINLQLDLSA